MSVTSVREGLSPPLYYAVQNFKELPLPLSGRFRCLSAVSLFFSLTPFSERDAKVRSFFKSPKLFWSFFSGPFSVAVDPLKQTLTKLFKIPLSVGPRCPQAPLPSPVSGRLPFGECKGTNYIRIRNTLTKLFFTNIQTLKANTWITVTYTEKFFEEIVHLYGIEVWLGI